MREGLRMSTRVRGAATRASSGDEDLRVAIAVSLLEAATATQDDTDSVKSQTSGATRSSRVPRGRRGRAEAAAPAAPAPERGLSVGPAHAPARAASGTVDNGAPAVAQTSQPSAAAGVKRRRSMRGAAREAISAETTHTPGGADADPAAPTSASSEPHAGEVNMACDSALKEPEKTPHHLPTAVNAPLVTFASLIGAGVPAPRATEPASQTLSDDTSETSAEPVACVAMPPYSAASIVRRRPRTSPGSNQHPGPPTAECDDISFPSASAASQTQLLPSLPVSASQPAWAGHTPAAGALLSPVLAPPSRRAVRTPSTTPWAQRLRSLADPPTIPLASTPIADGTPISATTSFEHTVHAMRGLRATEPRIVSDDSTAPAPHVHAEVVGAGKDAPLAPGEEPSLQHIPDAHADLQTVVTAPPPVSPPMPAVKVTVVAEALEAPVLDRRAVSQLESDPELSDSQEVVMARKRPRTSIAPPASRVGVVRASPSSSSPGRRGRLQRADARTSVARQPGHRSRAASLLLSPSPMEKDSHSPPAVRASVPATSSLLRLKPNPLPAGGGSTSASDDIASSSSMSSPSENAVPRRPQANHARRSPSTVTRSPKNTAQRATCAKASSPASFGIVVAQHAGNAECEDRWFMRSESDDGDSIPCNLVFGVADGHGGAVAAEHVRTTLPKLVLDHTRHAHTEEEVRMGLRLAFRACEEELLRLVRQNVSKLQSRPEQERRRYTCAGACVNAVLIKRMRKSVGSARKSADYFAVFTANVGDSRAVLGRIVEAAAGGSNPSHSLPDEYFLEAAALPRVPATTCDAWRAPASHDIAALDAAPSWAQPFTAHRPAQQAPHGSGTIAPAFAEQQRAFDELVAEGWEAVPLSRDQTCSVLEEARAVFDRSPDIHAVRSTVVRNERDDAMLRAAILAADDPARMFSSTSMLALQTAQSPNTRAHKMLMVQMRSHFEGTAPAPRPMRVAGSLVVTRAIGDFYLKHRDLSLPIFSSGCPYITCEPEITSRVLTAADRYIVVASDGLWESVKNTDAILVAAKAINDAAARSAHRSAGVGPCAEINISDVRLNPVTVGPETVQARLEAVADCFAGTPSQCLVGLSMFLALKAHQNRDDFVAMRASQAIAPTAPQVPSLDALLFNVPPAVRRRIHDDCTVVTVALPWAHFLSLEGTPDVDLCMGASIPARPSTTPSETFVAASAGAPRAGSAPRDSASRFARPSQLPVVLEHEEEDVHSGVHRDERRISQERTGSHSAERGSLLSVVRSISQSKETISRSSSINVSASREAVTTIPMRMQSMPARPLHVGKAVASAPPAPKSFPSSRADPRVACGSMSAQSTTAFPFLRAVSASISARSGLSSINPNLSTVARPGALVIKRTISISQDDEEIVDDTESITGTAFSAFSAR